MATIGEGLASFGRNVAERRERESNLALQKEALSQRKAEFDLNKQIKDAQLEDIFNEREEKKRLNDIRSTASGVIGSVSPRTEEVMGTELVPLAETSVLADFPEDRVAREPLISGSEELIMDIPDSLTTTKAEITTPPLDVPDEVRNALSSMTRKGRRGRRVRNVKSESIVDDFINGELDEKFEKKFKKGKRGRRVETKESKDTRADAKKSIMELLVAGDTPAIQEPDAPIEEEIAPSELPQESQVALPPELPPEEGELQGPQQQREVVTEEARFKSPAEMQQEIAQKFSQIDGFSELPVNEQQEFFRQAMLGQQSEQDKAELDLTNAKLNLTEAQTGKLLGEMNSSLDARDLKENQAKTVNLYKRMRDASSNFISMIDPNGEVGFDPTSFWSGVEEFLPNVLVRENKQQYDAFTQQWVQAVLRQDSGAAVPDNEQTKYTKIFIPRFGDSPATVQAKMRMIKSTENAMSTVLSISGLSDKDIFTQIHKMSPSADVQFMNSIKTSRDLSDAVADRLLTPEQASDIALLKGVNFAGGSDEVAGGKFKIVAR